MVPFSIVSEGGGAGLAIIQLPDEARHPLGVLLQSDHFVQFYFWGFQSCQERLGPYAFPCQGIIHAGVIGYTPYYKLCGDVIILVTDTHH